MCWADCFLCCFSLQTGVIFTSAYMLSLAIMGLLYLPFLPFSNEFGTFIIIYIYMLLILGTFLLALFGALSESKSALLGALILSVVALLFWLSLTVPSFLTKDPPNCLGFRCGESHWLLPRQWVPDEDKNDNFVVYTTPKLTDGRMLEWEEVTQAQQDLRSASFLDERRNRLEARLNSLSRKQEQDNGEKHLKAIEAKLNELNELRKAILAAQTDQLEEIKNQPRKEHDEKEDNEANALTSGNIETKDQETSTTTQKPKQPEITLERIIEQSKRRPLNRKKHQKIEVSNEIGTERHKRSLHHDQNEIERHGMDDNALWTQLVMGLVKNMSDITNGTQREFMNLGVNRTLESFLFGNESNSLISRTVNHQKTIISSCRAHKTESLINPTMIPSTVLAFVYFSMFTTAVVTLALYYWSFLMNHGIGKCCISECMM